MSTGKWAAYSKVWQEWEELLASAGSCGSNREAYLRYFIGTAYSQEVSSLPMGRKLSALAF